MPEPSGAAGTGGGGGGRMRTLLLSRRGGGPGAAGGGGLFGFSVRGGREHGTGFFVSRVEPGSEADARGLQVGDQIVRVNGLPVAEALHHELLQLVSQLPRLTLAVRTVGMLPVKDEDRDILKWQVVSNQSPEPVLGGANCHEVQLVLTVPQGAKLGCGVCKGPEWRPGIFVQFTKEGGLARSAGLRAGDQLLQCNGVPFTDSLPFSETVSLLRSSRHLALLVRPGAGADLFPSESSGYNSSASSIAGDLSPAPADKQRLSIVSEGPEDGLPLSDHYPQGEIITQTKNSCTIIHVGPEVSHQEQGRHLAQVQLVQQQQETKTVLVEVHCAPDEPKTASEVKPPPNVPCPPPPLNPPGPPSVLCKSESTSSISSFSSALSQEIERRRNQRRDSNGLPENISRCIKLSAGDEEKRHQHEQLMQEFKRAHRKMFAKSGDSADSGCTHGCAISSDDRNPPQQQQQQHRLVRNRVHSIDSGTLRHNSHSPPETLSDNSDNLTWPSKHSSSASSASSSASFGQPPPCPTPDYDTSSLASSMSSSSLVGSPKYGSRSATVFNGNKPSLVNGSAASKVQLSNSTATIGKVDSSNGKTSISVTTTKMEENTKAATTVNGNAKPNGTSVMIRPTNGVTPDAVEMESLQSFELANPRNPDPKPPETYFPKRRPVSSTTSSPKSTLSMESTATATRKPRPVSVTIGAYPSGVQSRREPSKLAFLNAQDEADGGKKPAADSLQSELARTLNRSDLKRRTEQLGTVASSPSSSPASSTASSTTSSSASAVTVSVKAIPPPPPPCLFDPRSSKVLPSAAPGIRSMAEKLNGTLGGTFEGSDRNRVTIRIGDESSEPQ